MLFNSIDYAVFLPICFLIYWFIVNRNHKLQNLFLLIVSYVFYGWWDWRFLSLIFVSSTVDYLVGLNLEKRTSTAARKALLLTSIVVNIGFLGFFKYYNFFVQSFVDAFLIFGKEANFETLQIILPVGISFYTFQTLSYTIDIYRKKIEPTKDIVAFFAFVSFFPQLVAGPIERASHLLPQFKQKRSFRYEEAADGVRQILWGLFKKSAIADNCAPIVSNIFSNSQDMSGSTLLLGAILFAFQIYGDFSGYSDIAIGSARLFGFDLMRNFAYPYFSRDIAEFWRRWHISLTTWFRDYVYIPLGGSKGSSWGKVRNTFIIFIVSGFWHGANWTFIAWGFINALFFLPLLLSKKNRTHLGTIAQGRLLPSVVEVGQIMATFSLVLLGWIFFRAENISHAFHYITGIFSPSLFSLPSIGTITIAKITLLISVLISVEWFQRDKLHGLQISFLGSWPRKAIYVSVFALLFFFAEFSKNQFIYFQF